MFIESYIYTNLARSNLIKPENFIYHPLQNLIQNKRKLISYLKQNSNLQLNHLKAECISHFLKHLKTKIFYMDHSNFLYVKISSITIYRQLSYLPICLQNVLNRNVL